ncbi:MAG: hypothetical protein SGILL_002353 [Bacillariaceae sp.]
MQFTPGQRSNLSRQALQAVVPPSMPAMLGLDLAVRQQAASANFWVGNMAVRNPGPRQPEPRPVAQTQNKRGPDKQQRKRKRCLKCVEAGGDREDNATECRGAKPAWDCQYEPVE